MKGAYIEIARKTLLEGLAFRVNTLIGILDTVILIAVNVAIWKAVYASTGTLQTVSLEDTITNTLFAIGISQAFWMDEYSIAHKIRTGAITNDILRPMHFGGMILAADIGRAGYRLLVEFLPAFAICALLFGLSAPASALALPLFVLSMAMSFLVLHSIGLIMSYISFWYFNIFSFVTIKNAAVLVLSGAYIPYWFMPDWMMAFVRASPFQAIYSAPMSIWLGHVNGSSVLYGLAKQALWIVALQLCAQALWVLGRRKLAVNGG